jgi:hypothetical protein
LTIAADWSAGPEADALQMGAVADTLELGAWGHDPVGLGRSWTFDLTLSVDVRPVLGRLSDRSY